MPQKILKEGELDFSGGIELMPEARAEELGGRSTTIGLNGQMSYALKNQFIISTKSWLDVEGRENYFRSGHSLSAQIIKPKTNQSRFIILPRIGVALNDDDIKGYGIIASIFYHEEMSERFSFYFGGGVLWGFQNLGRSTNSNGEDKIPMGLELIGHTGIAVDLSKGFRLNVEITPIIQLNSFDENYQVILSPQVGFGFTLKRKKM